MKAKTQHFFFKSDQSCDENKTNIWKTLTTAELDKCSEKFMAVKPFNTDKLSRFDFQRLMKEIGKQVTEEEAYQMILEA